MAKFAIDTGSSGSEYSAYLSWQAKESLDGSIPGRKFVLRTADGKNVFEGMSKGVVFDIENMKTGWCHSTGAKGVAPDWKWNSSLAKFEAYPGDGWKKGFHIPVAIAKDSVAVWEQAQAGAFSAFVGLVQKLNGDVPDGKLPLVKLTSVEKVETKMGISFVPVLEIVKWVDRPECLKASNGNEIDLGDDEPVKTTKQVAPEKDDFALDDAEF